MQAKLTFAHAHLLLRENGESSATSSFAKPGVHVFTLFVRCDAAHAPAISAHPAAALVFRLVVDLGAVLTLVHVHGDPVPVGDAGLLLRVSARARAGPSVHVDAVFFVQLGARLAGLGVGEALSAAAE